MVVQTNGNEEKNPILPGPSDTSVVEGDEPAEDVVSDETAMLPGSQAREGSPNAEDQDVADDDEEADERNDGSGNTGIRVRFEACLRRIGLCPCVVQECMGNQRTCRICEPRKLEQYNKLEEDYYRADKREKTDENLRGFMVIKFFLESPEVKRSYPLLVTNTMTALNVIKGVSVNVNTTDYYRYSIIEFWREFEAERTVDDHELVLELRHKHVRSNQHFIFVYQRDLEKYEYIKDKELYFIHPDTARRKNANKKQRDDPSFIQVLDPFFCMPNNPLDDIPLDSSQDTTPEKPAQIEDIPDDIVDIQVCTEGNVVQFSKSHDFAREEPPQAQVIPRTPPPHSHSAIESSPTLQPSSIVESSQVHSDIEVVAEPKEETLSVLAVQMRRERSRSRSPAIEVQRDSSIFSVEEDDFVNPIFCGTVFVKQGDRDLTLEEVKKLPNQKELARWSKRYLLLRDRQLFYVDDHDNMLKFYYMEDQQFREALLKRGKTKKEMAMLQLIGPMSDYEVYTSIKARRHHNAPHGGSIYLRKHEGSFRKPIKLMFCPKPKLLKKDEEGAPDLSSKGRKLWVTAMRLAKHGKKLKEGYQTHMAELKEYQLRLQVIKDPRVPMDFTQGVGRIVLDAEEIEEIRREPICKSKRFEKYDSFPKQALAHGPHLTQKYYHGDLSRQDSEALLRETCTDGAWLLRNSCARKNCLTISYLHQCRVYHKYVTAASYNDPSTGQRIYVATLDQQLAFYDVHTLTEFYRLNKGPTMICTLGKSVKNENQRDSTPPRSLVDQSPLRRLVPINLMAGSSKDPFNRSPQSTSSSKSPRSLKGFFKSIQKSKPKKLSLPQDVSQPSTSKKAAITATATASSAAVLPKHEEPLESPPSSSQEPSSSGISSSGGPLTPDSPPISSQDEQLTSSKTPQA